MDGLMQAEKKNQMSFTVFKSLSANAYHFMDIKKENKKTKDKENNRVFWEFI